MLSVKLLFPTLLLLSSILARDVPDNLRAFFNSHRDGDCPQALRASAAFQDGQTDDNNVFYCLISANSNVTYLKGPGSNYADMDIDCDGSNRLDGACSQDETGSDDTAFENVIEGFNIDGFSNLDAHIHTYVVLGNEGDDPSFDLTGLGVRPLSVVAVVCGDKLVYGIWGDTNGGTVTGEASLATGQLCFGDDAVSAVNGHTDHDVLFLAFPGDTAFPGADGAAWTAKTKEEFEASLATIGDMLVASL